MQRSITFWAFSNFEKFWEERFVLSKDYGNGQVILSLSVIFIAFFVIKTLQYLIDNKIAKDVKKTENIYDDLILKSIDSPVILFIYIISINVSINILRPPQYHWYINKLLYVLIALDITWLLIRLVNVLVQYLAHTYKSHEDNILSSMLPVIGKSLKIFIGMISFILIIQNMGYSVSSLLAGLGIGGLAVALAAKDTLANVFGSFTIFLDKPFIIGDWVAIGKSEGIVEDVGFRTTKIRTFEQYQISIPNNLIANDVVENYSRRSQRRISTTLSVTYDTTPEQLNKAVEALREMILLRPETVKDPCHVYLSQFGDSSLGIFLYFFIDSAEWHTFLKARHEIFLEIMKIFENLNIEFAFPSRTIYMANSENEQNLPSKEK